MFIENIEKNALLKPLQSVIGVVERKQPLPILSNVLIEKNEAGMRFVTTDLEIQIATQFDSENSLRDQSAITVSAKKFQEILRVLPDNNSVNLDLQENKLFIKSNRSRFSLQTLPAADFPKITEQATYGCELTLPQNVFRKLLGAVQYAMAQQDIRYYLNGVLLVIESNLIKMVATDGHRLAYASAALSNSYNKNEVILPRKTVVELFKLVGDTDEPMTLKLAEKQVLVTVGGTVLTSKVVDGKFPDYNKVIPKYTNHLPIQRDTILQALQRAAILSNEKHRGVRLVLTEKNLRIISNNSEQEEAQEDIETDYHANALDIGFNVNYLLDGLQNIASDTVVFSFGDPNSSVLLTVPDNDQFKYVVMPMRI